MKEHERTTSEIEWEFVEDPNLKNLSKYGWVRGDRGGRAGGAARRLRRQPWPPEYLRQRMEEQNARLAEGHHELLILDEAIAARLCTPVWGTNPRREDDRGAPHVSEPRGGTDTGPMYHKYNLVLRAKSDSEFIQKLKREACDDNDYVSTIHAINSCVVKMTKLMEPCKARRAPHPHLYLL